MWEFALGVLASLMATLIWEWYKNLSKFRQKLTKPVDSSDKRIIKRRLDELNALTKWIIGDLIEELSQLIQKREPRWKISYVIARTMLELCRTLLEEVSNW